MLCGITTRHTIDKMFIIVKKMNKLTGLFVLVLTILFSAGSGFAAETADAVMKKAAAKINGAAGITASFTLVSDGHKVSGTLKSAGKKFAIQTSSSSTWYDGKSMWTYNAGSNETTLIIPTSTEVAEANPLTLVNSYSSSFTASLAKTQKKGSKTIVLSPKSKKLGYKSVHVTISEASYLPTVIVVIPSSGSKMTLSIGKTVLNAKLPASTFVYPHKKYPKAELVDLR